MDSKDISNQMGQATRWSTFTELAAKLIAPITNMILARLLTPAMFGVVATVTMITSFAEILTDAGFQKYLVQHDFKDRLELDQYTNVGFWTNLFIAVFMWLGISVFSRPLSQLVGSPGKEIAVIIASLSLPIQAFSSIQMARFRRDFDFKSLFFIRIITASVPLIITVPLAFATRSYWALIVGTLAGHTVTAIALTWRSEWKPKPFFSWNVLKDMFSYSWWILLESITNWLTSYIGTFIVSVFLTQHFIGLYKTTMSTSNQIISLITAATSAPLFVALSKLKNDHKNMLRTYYDFIGALGFFIVPMGIGIWLYRDLITWVLLGEQWMESSTFLGLWGLTSSFSLLFGTYANGFYNAKGKTYLSFLTQILHLAALIPVLLLSAPKGFMVLCVARCAVRLELVLVQQITMKVSMKASLWQQLKRMLPAIIGTAVMAAGGMLFKTIGSSYLMDALGIIVCIVLYLLICFIFFREQLLSALRILGFNFIKDKQTQ